jgi:hypothetical protein
MARAGSEAKVMRDIPTDSGGFGGGGGGRFTGLPLRWRDEGNPFGQTLRFACDYALGLVLKLCDDVQGLADRMLSNDKALADEIAAAEARVEARFEARIATLEAHIVVVERVARCGVEPLKDDDR